MTAEMSGEPEKLVGKYFHSANETNKIEWQGLVIGEPHPGWYLVQLFEWASGAEEKEHFFHCPKCGQFVDKRELRDVIFHVTDHKPSLTFRES